MAGFSIVGIGSSAGGLEPLSALFRAVPAQSGLAFVVAAHLDPTHESHLVELLGRCTEMPVAQIDDGMRVERDHVYIIAPDRELAIKKGVLRSTRPTLPRGHRHPVDVFFRSLAEDQGERAIGIVLSGTGTNGSLGLRFIKAEGGIVIAQEPDTAAFSGMPRSAIGTGVVDLVLPPEKIPQALLDLARLPDVQEKLQELDEAAPPDQLRDLLALLRNQARRDFNGYRKRTLLRRIHRRMGLHRIPTLNDYIDRLRNDSQEVKALVADLTINVTGFFRDPEAWQALAKTVVGPLVQERPTDATIRVWVPACSTGEEAYSIAMLLVEAAEAAGKSFDVRLFATDVADSVLGPARAGHYPGSIALDIGEDRVARFFEQEDDTYRVRKSLREMVTFAPQNLLQDPPFSRIDLISCRNLLIYLEPEMQKRLLALFHFALREGGHLFLGSAETTTGQEGLFQPVSKKWRIFRRMGKTRHDIVDFPLIGGGHPMSGVGPDSAEPGGARPRAGATMDRALLERYAPASVLIDARFRVQFLRGQIEDYLRQPGGEPSYNLLAMAREGLRTPLRALVHQALDDGQEVGTDARVVRNGTHFPVRLVATPLKQGGESPDQLLIGFFEADAAGDTVTTTLRQTPPGENQLQTELDTAREDLRLSITEMEGTNEELKASNEEIRSINEELQASNEELETSKEELQSLNEELNTLNNQLQAKVGELEERTADLNNLLVSSDIATLFLDRALCIRWFTPAMKALFELLPTDVGRPIAHFAQRFSGGDVMADAKAVLSNLSPIDNEVLSDHGRWYLRHVAPYRTDDDRIAGVVMTFTDITDLKAAEEAIAADLDAALALQEISTRLIVEQQPGDLFAQLVDAAIAIMKSDAASIQLLDPKDDSLELLAWKNFHPESATFWERVDAGSASSCGRALADKSRVVFADVEQVPFTAGSRDLEEYRRSGLRAVNSTPLISRTGRLLGMISTHFSQPHQPSERDLRLLDVLARQASDLIERAQAEERLRKVLETDAVGVLFLDPASGKLTDANSAFLHMTGYSRDDIEAGKLSWRSLTPEDWVPSSEEQMATLVKTGRIGPYEKQYLLKDGSRSWMLIAGALLDDGKVVKYAIDIHDRKQAEQERELLTSELSHRVKNTLAVVQALAMQTDGRLSTEEFRSAFIGRLQSLAEAHSLLLNNNWRSADLEKLIERTVAAHASDRPGRITLDGGPLELTPKQGLGLGLVLHELSTNAAKYGALSKTKGRLLLSWRKTDRNGTPAVELLWQERDGPVTGGAPEKGFGSKLIERACTYELNGEAELAYAPEGLDCRIWFPLDGG